MCSINGCVDFCTPHAIDKQAVRAAGRRMAHRGPDAHGEFFAPFVGFYHNRLAVMDPQRGAQPMTVSFGGKTYTVVQGTASGVTSMFSETSYLCFGKLSPGMDDRGTMKEEDPLMIGYITRKGSISSRYGEMYISELMKYKEL